MRGHHRRYSRRIASGKVNLIMHKELKSAINDICECTGIEVGIFSPAGARIVQTDGFNAKSETTDFSFRIGQNEYAGKVNASGDEGKRYAALIVRILESEKRNSQPLTIGERFKKLFLSELDETATETLRAEYIGKPFHYYVLTVVTDSHGKLTELKSFLEALGEQDDLVVPYDDKAVAYIKRCGGDDEYQSANDFAYTLYENIKEELRINIVINVGGTAHTFDDLTVYFRRCMFAYSFGNMMSPGSHIYSYKEYIMMKMISDIPKTTLSSYLSTLLDKNSLEIISDPELISTAEEFLKNSLNISETSRSMYMHRNTLIYRLDKIETATGLNLRRFNDAVIFRLITILNKLTNKT